MARPEPQWWEFRRANNRSGSIYTCPFCGGKIPALTEHILVVPEGDGSKRRHAHTECAAEAREAGRLPSRSEWKKAQKEGSLWERWTRWRSSGRRDDEAI